MSVVFITHNLGVVSEIADRVLVMYAGQVVEDAPVDELLRSACHDAADVKPAFFQAADQIERLIGCDAAADNQRHTQMGCWGR